MKIRSTGHTSWANSMAAPGNARRPERYGIAVIDGWLAVNRCDQSIELVRDLDQAWLFHTHEKAVRTARQLTTLQGRSHDVVRLR